MESITFRKNERIRKRSDYTTLHRQGKRVHAEHFTLILKKNPLGCRRLGVTTGKKVGNSVKRNRMKRLLREFFRLNKEKLPDSHDLWIIVRKDFSAYTYDQVREALENILGDRLVAT
ncbi:MAG TPA: ribonuclease P protein component [Syntrophales bacterium]|jgi:ribonuclease P protein component|nr:ribonuclease P protein component [Syntrophales bacterium]HOX94431.1 ribonuclease P protein component [Syntrophales bacterium]HPI56808.1 ribonuclease P protein component [Syntrophales bacterium]HPN25754.1 ribonuclease P protein component [Syntrophales bacterium]HQM28719.1 ribonuclease P protein component [Syntrophales bacterium]